jgi:hypothetical protein
VRWVAHPTSASTMKLNVTCRTQALLQPLSATQHRRRASPSHRIAEHRIAEHRIASHFIASNRIAYPLSVTRSQAPASQAAVCGHSAFSCEHMSDAQPMDWPINCVDRKGSGGTAHVAGACEAREEEQARVNRVVACVTRQTRATLTVGSSAAINIAAEAAESRIRRCGGLHGATIA